MSRRSELENKARAYRNSHADLKSGLLSDQVQERTKQGLVNKALRRNTRPTWKIFLSNICSYFNIALFVVVIVQIIAGVKLLNYYTFILPVIFNITIGIVTDLRAKVSTEKLKIIGRQDVNVVRDGKIIGILDEKVVLGDIIHLNSGDQIVADSIVREGSVRVDESMLTGESVRIEKKEGDTVLAGSFVVSGHCVTEAVKVSSLNYSASIEDQAKQFRRPKSELKTGCFRIFRITAGIATVIGVSMFLLAYFKTGRLEDGTFDFAGTMENLSGSFVAMIPTGLYLLTSVTLTKGSIALGRRKINVQELYSIETLARVDMICFDKTGTLTDGNLVVERIHTVNGLDKGDVRMYIASIVDATEDKNVTAKALKAYCGENHLLASEALPFTSENKYSGATIDDVTWVIGAPGFVPAYENKEAELLAKDEASKGFRVLGFYSNKKGIKDGKVAGKCTLEAVIVISDHIKEDAEHTIKWFAENEVQSKVISGDDAASVAVIAKRCGIPNADNYVDLSKVPDSKLEDYAEKTTIFGRATPEQKAHLIKIFQRHGHSVAMTGDGVNDVLALKQADCSIVMGSGSTAAKHCAHLVSVDDNFAKLPDVVFEGRRVINNLQRTSSLFLTKTVFAVILSVTFLILSLFTTYSYPLKTTNLFLWEIVVIGAGGVLLAFEPSKDRLKGSFVKNILDIAWPGGLLAAAMTLMFFTIYACAPSFMNKEQFDTVATLAITFLAYASLLRISIPFTKYRLFVFILLAVGGIGGILLDRFLPTTEQNPGSFITVIYYEQLNWKLILILVAAILVFATLYIGLIQLIKYRNKKREEKKFR